MKIAHIVCTYPPYYGGMGNVVFQMASDLVDLGHEVEVLTPDYYAETEIKPETESPAETHEEKLQAQIDYATRLKPALQYGNAAYIPQLGSELDRFDLVHLHYPFFGVANLVRRWKLKNPHKPLVVSYHMDTRAPGWKGLIFKYYTKFWMPKILGSADKLIVSSFDYLESSDAAGLFKDKWVELPFGVNTDNFKPNKNGKMALKQLELDPEIPTILFVGGMDDAHYFKGVDILLKALLILKTQNKETQCVLVGDGNLRNDFEAKARIFGLENSVRFCGSVRNEDLPAYYNLADLFVLPSINKGEAFGVVLLEAMASGVPVIATDLPGVRAVAKDGGMVVPPNDPLSLAKEIDDFFSGSLDYAALKNSVQKIAKEKYEWQVIVKRLEEIYQQLRVV